MSIPAPHFLLYSEAYSSPEAESEWQFVLESLDSRKRIAAADCEPDAQGERVELLAVVRGLEALEQPSRVILITKSRYVSRGLAQGLREWRESGWRWERFGRWVPVRDADLWQRIDHAMHYHQVECRMWRFDTGHAKPHDRLRGQAGRGSEPNRMAAVDGEDTAQAILIGQNRFRHGGTKPSLWKLMASWWRWFWHIPSAVPSR